MSITMYDSTEPSAIPANATLVAAYVDGYGGYSEAVARFGAKRVISVSVGNNDADVADVETGGMSAGDLPGWIERQVARGIKRPVVYCNVSTWPSVKEAVAGRNVSYWIAHPGGPATMAGADAVQNVWESSWDSSVVQPSFPFYNGTVSPPPVTPPVTPPKPFYGRPVHQLATVDTVNYTISWLPPTPVKGVPAPTLYQVYVYDGVTNEAHAVVGYGPATTKTTKLQVNGLKHGSHYIVHIVANGDKKYVGRDVFATLLVNP